MAQAARAIIIENDNLLVMFRNKHGSEYFTLVGGRIQDGESTEQGLAREVMEETVLQVTRSRLVFVEPHPAPYNEQYIYLCEVAPHQDVAIQTAAEEALMNRIGLNTHEPVWTTQRAFAGLPFRTPQLQAAILQALTKGFPDRPINL
jgi:ADP-ribose pyrophosphatase YjhB (NUDIX family)